MSISGISGVSSSYPSRPASATPASQSGAATPSPATSAPTATAASAPPASAPKVNSTKVALKESNEPLPVLTKQAKHGDPVAKLLLKKVNQKQAAAKARQAVAKASADPAETTGESVNEKV